MKRKMIAVATAYVSGLFFASFFTGAENLIVILLLFLSFVLYGRTKKFPVSDFAVVAVSFAVAFSVYGIYTSRVYRVITSYDVKEGSFSGRVIDYDLYENDKARYSLKGKINNRQRAEITVFCDNLDADYGDSVNIESCTFSKISGDYLFDSESYYKAERIFLTVENCGDIVLEKRHSRKIKNFLSGYKSKIISDFRVTLGEECGGFLAGMVFGEKSFISDNVKDSLYRTGIGHVMAVSGLHVSVMALALMAVMNFLKVNKFVSFGVANVFMLFVTLMADCPVSAVRAVIMLEIAFSARLFLRQNDTFNSLAIAVLVICLENPYIIHSTGFWLSVSGTFGIGVFAPYMVKNIKKDTYCGKIKSYFFAMLCTTLAVMPVSMLYFSRISLFSPVSNMFIVPLCSVCIVLGMLYTVTGGLAPVLKITGFIIKIILFIAEKISGLEFSSVCSGDDFSARIAVICIFCVMLAKVCTEKRKFVACVTAFSVGLTFTVSTLRRNSSREVFTVAVLGKGNNAVSVISFMSHTYVFDLSGNMKNAVYAEKYLSEIGTDTVDIISLGKNSVSAYPTYKNEMYFVNVKNWYTSCEIEDFSEGSPVIFGTEGYTIENGRYTIKYSKGILDIVYRDSEMIITPAKDNISEKKSLSVYYGNIPKNTDLICDGKSIYLDKKENIFYDYSGMNNFKAEFCDDGSFKIKNLK